ncbi:DHH family phosphoesterase [Cohnella nanjingensis]|uniref:Bifunctional oligoribonuclease/PAP phosphatase NrnA n=1 Tax=Cohnella nanjingensis TaxID=1387779 RepID=A0A7X0RSV1_9BACL|nr:bifunctional oligoribonuclease/PAP phosphatase NrnA [Cohnella nanjingensis]MBB6672868.1 bifunctional oligoribonuclease/PAP phosphatase NrnA [Cohnella nanjingensis]
MSASNGNVPVTTAAGGGDAALSSWEEQLDKAVAFIRERDDFLVVSHVQPDGDAISSTVAIGWLLEKLGKTYALYNDGPAPSRLRYLWGSDRLLTLAAGKPDRTYRSIIAVDCADFARVGAAKELFAPEAELLNIDHHPTNDAFGAANLLRFDAAATAEILFELLEAARVPLDVDVATAIYTGMLTDTGGFRYANTSPKVLAIASKLVELGVDGPGLAEQLLERMTMEQMSMIQRALARLTFSEDQRVGWLWVTPEDMSETGAKSEDLEGLVNYPRNIEGVEVGILFKQHGDDAVKVSMRSAGRVNVAAVAQQFQGGGHVRAAGCRVAAPLPDAIAQVVEAIRKALDAE